MIVVKSRLWIGDAEAWNAEDSHDEYRGDLHILKEEGTYKELRRPIGYIWTKPRVRIKAWTRPILDV